MYLISDTALVTSASDLKLASECEFAFLRVLDARLGFTTQPLPEETDPLYGRAVALGNAHELRLLERYRAEHGAAIAEFERPPSRDVEEHRALAVATRDAMLAGAPVVYQGVFFDETDPELPFVGYADFLVRTPDGRYRVVDTKLARRVRVTALLQLAAYHEQLGRLGVPVDDTVELVLGDERSELAHIDDIAPVFGLRRARMHAIIAEHRAEGAPVRWHDARYARDGRCIYCEGPAAEADDLVTVAGMRLTQRARLIEAGIHTLTDLAETPARPEGCEVPATTYAKLHLQARLQRGARGADEHAVPAVVVTDPRPIAALPTPSPGDLFFDFEGDPMYSERDAGGETRWGLDYLFGWVDTSGAFDCLWAHSQHEERLALRAFLAFVVERRQRHPDLHVYHYASYEKSHLLSIAARHGEGEAIVDQLLREGVLVDLYPVVTSALRVGVPSYSIKKLEPLYMDDDEREGVTNAGDSVQVYVDSCLALEAGNAALSEQLRASIADYNAYDCRSTLGLRDWLRGRPEAQALDPIAEDADRQDRVFEPSPLDVALQTLGEQAPDAAAATAYRLAAAAIDYHRRENKSFWWAHFDRLEQPSDLWEDARGVFVVEHVEVERDWHREGRQRVERRHLVLHGQWAPGSGVPKEGFLVYNDAPVGHPPGFRFARQVTIAEVHDDGGLLIVETCPPDLQPWHVAPSHLTPGPPPKAASLVAAIEAWGQTVVDASPDWPSDAMSSLLLGRAPAQLAQLEPLRGPDDGVRAVVASLQRMDEGYLAVQGPPGTGKTYLAAHVIQELVAEHGWKVGVTAQSHKVVENVFDAIVMDANLDAALVAKAPPSDAEIGYYDGSPFTELQRDEHSRFAAEHESEGYVIGGTAWDFTNRGRVQERQLDLLVVEEAGQFSLANTIAVAVSARRILLLGDPQQLPQVSQGIHPAPVDGSALGHVIGGHAVLPADFGYFLDASRRMDAALARPVSELSYEGQLRSHECTQERLLEGVEPGLHPVPVAHEGNATSSHEEADRVVELVRSHLGMPWTREAGALPAPLDEDGIIVVSPYNAQVELIREHLDAAGCRRVAVGTVDKFQGREAVIAIVSLAASSAAEVPRGLDFLLSRNRLNVSISRAKWAAYLVYSPGLLDALPMTPEGVATLSRFIRLVREGG